MNIYYYLLLHPHIRNYSIQECLEEHLTYKRFGMLNIASDATFSFRRFFKQKKVKKNLTLKKKEKLWNVKKPVLLLVSLFEGDFLLKKILNFYGLVSMLLPSHFESISSRKSGPPSYLLDLKSSMKAAEVIDNEEKRDM